MTPEQEHLEELIARAMERFDEDGEAGVDAVCSEHPEFASRIRAGLRQCELAGLLHRDSDGPLPPSFGRYRPVSRLGVGGMGIVYLAETGDGERVALKIIRPDLVWFDGARERFRREVEAIASIDHPGVVPVLEVGEQEGVPWFAMECVEGLSLADVMATRRGRSPADLTGADLWRTVAGEVAVPEPFGSTWFAAAMHVVEQVAEAMHYVHLRGIIHRDLKPSNVMLRPDGRAQVLDFGLAHVSGSASLTRTGATIGSLAYMSPEQLRGEAIDARTDVYSLGATMYELLTLTPPFSSDDEVELRTKVLEGACPRPRALVPDLPPSLDLLCRVAMDRDRVHRPVGMDELASDLSRIAVGRSIAARLPSRRVRAGRFFRRHPAVASGLAVAALFLVMLPVVLLLQERAAGRVIRAERTRAESNYDDALSAVRRLLVEMADEDLRSQPGLAPLREQMFREAITVLSDLERTTEDPRARQLRARALSLLGDSLADQDQHEGSRRALEAALSIWRERTTSTPDAVELAIAATRQKLAISLHRLGEAESALVSVDRAIADIERFDWPDSMEIATLHALSQGHNTRAILLQHEGDSAGAGEAMQRALELKRTLAERADGPRARQGLADQLLKNALFVEFERAREMLEEMIAMAAALPDPMPGAPARAELLARGNRRLGVMLAKQGKGDEAERHLVAAAAASAEFLYQNPRLPRAFSEQGEDLNNLSILRYDQRRFDEALAKAEQAEALQRRALELAPGTPRFEVYLGRHVFNQIQALTQLGRPAQLAAVAEKLGGMEVNPRMTISAAFGLLLAARNDGAGESDKQQWLKAAGRLVARAEAMGQRYEPMLDHSMFDMLEDDPAAVASLERMRAKK